MNIFILLISSSIAVALLILHSYLFRGRRITLNFFVFAFVYAFYKEGGTPPAAYPYLKLYEFLNENISPFVKYITATIGWVFTLYISWCIAERILQRINFFKERIFSTLLVCWTVIMGISYGIETAAINIGWWKWNVNRVTLKYLFIGGYSLATLEAWSFFTIVFLAAFFLIEGSRYKKADCKIIFAIFPFIYSWTVLCIGTRMPSPSEEISSLIICFILPLVILAFFNKLPFEYGIIRQDNQPSPKMISLILKNIPLLMLLFMLLIILAINIGILKKPILIISAIPVIFIALLSIKRIPLYIIFIISLIGLILGKEKMILPIVPVIVVFGFWVVSISKAYVSKKERVKTA